MQQEVIKHGSKSVDHDRVGEDGVDDGGQVGQGGDCFDTHDVVEASQ